MAKRTKKNDADQKNKQGFDSSKTIQNSLKNLAVQKLIKHIKIKRKKNKHRKIKVSGKACTDLDFPAPGHLLKYRLHFM